MDHFSSFDTQRYNGLPGGSNDEEEKEGKRRNYKLIADPQLKSGPQKIYRFDGHNPGDPMPVIPRDPRSRMKRFWTKREALHLPVPKFKFDQYYVGTILPKEVTFTNLNDNIHHQFLRDMCFRFGNIEECKVFYHPNTKKHLGLAKVLFTSTRSARTCVNKLDGTSKMGNIMTVFLDSMGKERTRLMEEATGEKPKQNKPSSPAKSKSRHGSHKEGRGGRSGDHHRTSGSSQDLHTPSSSGVPTPSAGPPQQAGQGQEFHTPGLPPGPSNFRDFPPPGHGGVEMGGWSSGQSDSGFSMAGRSEMAQFTPNTPQTPHTPRMAGPPQPGPFPPPPERFNQQFGPGMPPRHPGPPPPPLPPQPPQPPPNLNMGVFNVKQQNMGGPNLGPPPGPGPGARPGPHHSGIGERHHHQQQQQQQQHPRHQRREVGDHYHDHDSGYGGYGESSHRKERQRERPHHRGYSEEGEWYEEGEVAGGADNGQRRQDKGYSRTHQGSRRGHDRRWYEEGEERGDEEEEEEEEEGEYGNHRHWDRDRDRHWRRDESRHKNRDRHHRHKDRHRDRHRDRDRDRDIERDRHRPRWTEDYPEEQEPEPQEKEAEEPPENNSNQAAAEDMISPPAPSSKSQSPEPESRYMSLESRIQSLLRNSTDSGPGFGSGGEEENGSSAEAAPQPPDMQPPPQPGMMGAPPLPYGMQPLEGAPPLPLEEGPPLPPAEEAPPPPLPPEPAPELPAGPPPPGTEGECSYIDSDQAPTGMGFPHWGMHHADMFNQVQVETVQMDTGGMENGDDNDDRMSLSSLSSGEEKVQVIQLNVPQNQAANANYMYNNHLQNYQNNLSTGGMYSGQDEALASLQQQQQMLNTPQDQEEEKSFLVVLEQVMTELRHIMRKDLQKKMVENSAFKSFENWWDYEDNKEKRMTLQSPIRSPPIQPGFPSNLRGPPLPSTSISPLKTSTASSPAPSSAATVATATSGSPSNQMATPKKETKDMSHTLAALFDQKEGSMGGFGMGGLLGIRGGIPKLPSFRRPKFRPATPPPPEEEEEEEDDKERKDEEDEDRDEEDSQKFKGPCTPEESENDEAKSSVSSDEESEDEESMKKGRRKRVIDSDESGSESDKADISDDESEESPVSTSSEEDSDEEEEEEASEEESEEEEESEADVSSLSSSEDEEEMEDKAAKAEVEKSSSSSESSDVEVEADTKKLESESSDVEEDKESAAEKAEEDDEVASVRSKDKEETESEKEEGEIEDEDGETKEPEGKAEAEEEKMEVDQAEEKEKSPEPAADKSKSTEKVAEEGTEKEEKVDKKTEETVAMALLQMKASLVPPPKTPPKTPPVAAPDAEPSSPPLPKPEKPKRVQTPAQLAMAAEHNYFAPMLDSPVKEKPGSKKGKDTDDTDSASEGEATLIPTLPPYISMDHSYCMPYFPIEEHKLKGTELDDIAEEMIVDAGENLGSVAAEVEIQEPVKPKQTPKRPRGGRKLADVTNLGVSRELLGLFPTAPEPKPVPQFKARTLEGEMQVTYEFLFKGIDLEDVDFIKRRYEELLGDDSPQTYWLNDTHWVDHSHTRIPDPVPPKKRRKYSQQDEVMVAHKTGCARTEGYYKISHQEKHGYLKDFRGVLKTKEEEDKEREVRDAAQKKKVQISREARSESRRWQNVLQSMGEDLGDLLKFNQLKFRKKNLKFAKSGIHDWGLFALEPIAEGEMVIEYVGAVVRQSTADLREKKYEAMGIGSSYLFRIDHDTIIDATKCGNLARFINHSCNPNCVAKIITVEALKKIVIYSKRDINVNEEITYDYKFPIEDEKIPCLCGTSACRGTLN